MNVFVLLAEGFEECEALVPVDVLRRAGATVCTASLADDTTVSGAHGIKVVADVRIDDIDPQSIDCLVLPGGGEGTRRLGESKKVESLIRHCADNGIYIGAICAAPSILGKMGLLAGRRAVCFPEFQEFLADSIITRSKVETDDIFITAVGAGAAYEFAFALTEALYGSDNAETLKSAMLF